MILTSIIMPRARNMNFVDGEPIRCVVVGDGAVGKVRDGVSLSAFNVVACERDASHRLVF